MLAHLLLVFAALSTAARAQCPATLEPVLLDGCPGSDAATEALEQCDDEDLKTGDLCEGDGECGTDTDLNNCPHNGAFGVLSARVSFFRRAQNSMCRRPRRTCIA